MTNYYDFCMDMEAISESLGVECKIIPMRRYRYRDSNESQGAIREMRITFAKTPLSYTIALTPERWNRVQVDDNEYDRFKTSISEKIKNYLINI